MEPYSTEEEQLEALRRWWNENGRSTLLAIVLALGVGFGWQAWKHHGQNQREEASAIYQRMLQTMEAGDSPAQQAAAAELAQQLKQDYSGSTYAQFAALQLARMAVVGNDLAQAETQLRWVLNHADGGSDVALITQLRLARVLAASGDTEQALKILDQAEPGAYEASYAIARGDILLSLKREDEARRAYGRAQMLAGGESGRVNLTVLEQKLQALNPVPASGDTGAENAVEADRAVKPTDGREG